MVNKKKADRSIIWLIPLALTPYFIIGGLWSLSQPWGESWQKILVILLLSVLWLSAIYFENERRLNLNGVKRKKRLQLILALGSALFVICGAIIAICYQAIMGLMISGVFGLFSALFANSYRKSAVEVKP
jgi:hypothetical protein